MTKTWQFGWLGLAVLMGAMVIAFSATTSSAKEDASDAPQPAAVEADMHEFMEYVFEPPYKRLKASLATAPADRSAWKGIKSDALILAEAANLLLHRHPDTDVALWDKNAIAVRQQGGELYQAAKKRDFDLTAKQFATMLTKCNHCHDEFAGGEHQLKP